MNKIKRSICRMVCIACAIIWAVACAGCKAANPPSTVSFVDLTRYMGLWYEIAKYPQFFERGLVGITAQYALQDNGTVSVTNKGFKGELTGPESMIKGVASVVDPATNAKLSVRFDPFPASLFPGDYWIIELGDNYEYAVVSDPTRRSLWILSRTPQMDSSVYDTIVAGLEEKGFDTGKLELTPQPEM